MDLIRLPIADIKPAPYNPRTIPDEEFARLITSLETFGYVDPMIVNIRDNRNIVVGGNQRLEALKALDYCEVEVVAVDLSIPEEMALNLALNKISGRWDYDKLANVLSEINASPLDVLTTGFSQVEIDSMLNLDTNFSFDLPPAGTSDGYRPEREDDDDGPKDVTGTVENRGYSCHVYFTDKDDAERFLRFIGANDPTIKEYTKIVKGDELPLPDDV